MNAFVVISALLAVANAGIVSVHPAGEGVPTFRRAPSHDSASIESHRLGGNFAYSTAEAHAFAKVTPQLSTAVHPVAETTHVHHPAPVAHVQPAPLVETTYAAQPVLGQQAIYAEQAIVGPVASHTEVHQPYFKTQRIVEQVVPAIHAAAPAYASAYAHGYAAGPAYAQGYPVEAAYAQGYAAGPAYAQGLPVGAAYPQGYAAGPAYAHGYAGAYAAAPAVAAAHHVVA